MGGSVFIPGWLGLPFRENPSKPGEILNVSGQCIATIEPGGASWRYDYTAFIIAACNYFARAHEVPDAEEREP